jgi:hypothetical protein
MMNPLVTLALAAALSAGSPAPAPSAEPEAAPPPMGSHPKHKKEAMPLDPAPDCSVAVTGAVKASFKCKVDARPHKTSGLRLGFTPASLPAGVGAFLVNGLELPPPAKEATYTASDLKGGRILISGPDHRTFGASAGQQPVGTVTLEIKKLAFDPHGASAKGTLTAHLVPDGGKSKDEVIVTVKF